MHTGGQAPHGKDLLRASSGVGHQQSGAVGREAGGREDGVRIQGQPLECMLQALRSLGAQPESLSAAQQGLQGRGADELLAMKVGCFAPENVVFVLVGCVSPVQSVVHAHRCTAATCTEKRAMEMVHV